MPKATATVTAIEDPYSAALVGPRKLHRTIRLRPQIVGPAGRPPWESRQSVVTLLRAVVSAAKPWNVPDIARFLDREEITGERAGGLLAQERPPRLPSAFGCRRDVSEAQHLADRGRRDRKAEQLELAGDPLIAPMRVLAGET
jgi:hypothetical protein